MNKRNAGDERSNPGSVDIAVPVGGLPRYLVRCVARTGPAELAERLEEEWLADLSARTSAISRVRFVLGCLWATRVISLDHALARLPLTATAAGAGTAATGTATGGLFSRRTTTFAMVALLHVAVFYVLLTSVSTSFTKVNNPPLQNAVLNQPHLREPPSLPPPNVHPVKLDIAKLDPSIALPSDDPGVIHGQETTDAPPDRDVVPPVVPEHVAKRSAGGPGSGFPSTDDFYPSASRRLEEQGVSAVQVCVDATGRLTRDPTLVTSSGSNRLDEGALKLARAGSGHYRPSTDDGRAVASCYAFRIRFQITK